jgi:hypothetical protein
MLDAGRGEYDFLVTGALERLLVDIGRALSIGPKDDAFASGRPDRIHLVVSLVHEAPWRASVDVLQPDV